jgi:hypothetical protein
MRTNSFLGAVAMEEEMRAAAAADSVVSARDKAIAGKDRILPWDYLYNINIQS